MRSAGNSGEERDLHKGFVACLSLAKSHPVMEWTLHIELAQQCHLLVHIRKAMSVGTPY